MIKDKTMTINNKTYFYNYSVIGDGYDKFNFGILLVKNENCFDPVEWIIKEARKQYPDYISLNITALNLI